MGWTPVEVAMPGCDGLYIVTTEVAGLGRFTKLAKYSIDEDLPTWYRDCVTGYPENAETEYEKVVAWMGWPEPYEVKE